MPQTLLHTVMSWLDFFRSLVNTRLCPFSFVEDTEDITSQLLSSLAEVDNTQVKFVVNEAELITLNRSTTLDSHELTAGRSVFQVPVQEWKDCGVARLHGLWGDVGGPVLQSVQGHVGQGDVAQAQLQSHLLASGNLEMFLKNSSINGR